MRTILPLLVVGVFAGAISIGATDNLPAFKAERWVNSAPLTRRGAAWQSGTGRCLEYTCINWIRTLSNIQA